MSEKTKVIELKVGVLLDMFHFHVQHRPVGLVVKASASRGFDTHFRCVSFSGLSHTTDVKVNSPVATLQGAWHHRVSAGTGRPDVNILWLDEMKVWSATTISV